MFPENNQELLKLDKAYTITPERCAESRKEIDRGEYTTLEELKNYVAPEEAKTIMDKYQGIDVYSRPEPPELEPDSVNSPAHYQFKCGLEVLDLIRELLGDHNFISYCEGNVIKYVLRARKKGKYNEDMRKAQVYLNKLIESQTENNCPPPF